MQYVVCSGPEACSSRTASRYVYIFSGTISCLTVRLSLLQYNTYRATLLILPKILPTTPTRQAQSGAPKSMRALQYHCHDSSSPFFAIHYLTGMKYSMQKSCKNSKNTVTGAIVAMVTSWTNCPHSHSLHPTDSTNKGNC